MEEQSFEEAEADLEDEGSEIEEEEMSDEGTKFAIRFRPSLSIKKISITVLPNFLINFLVILL